MTLNYFKVECELSSISSPPVFQRSGCQWRLVKFIGYEVSTDRNKQAILSCERGEHSVTLCGVTEFNQVMSVSEKQESECTFYSTPLGPPHPAYTMTRSNPERQNKQLKASQKTQNYFLSSKLPFLLLCSLF